MADDSTSTPDGSETESSESQVEVTVKPETVPPEVKAALRKANKEAEALRLKLKEFEDRDKTEAQKLAERAEVAEKQRDALLIESVKARVALIKGLPAELVDRLRGSTEEEMAADADALLALLPAAQASRPRGDVDQGVRSALPLNGDPLLRDLKAKLGIA